MKLATHQLGRQRRQPIILILRRRQVSMIVTLGTGAIGSSPSRKITGIVVVAALAAPASRGPDGPYAPYVAGFRQGLKELGYIEGQNVAIEFRWAPLTLLRPSDMLPGQARSCCSSACVTRT